MSKILNFAVVGLGHIGKRHCTVIANNPKAKLVATADVDITLKDYVDKTYQVPFYSSIEQLIAGDLEIDIVNICTPNGYHCIHTVKALRAHYHVICEKPMALSAIDAEMMIDTANMMNKQIFCVMQNRYSPSAQWLKELILNDTLGKINNVVVNCFWNRDNRYYQSSDWRGTKELDGGILYTQFSHYLDTIFWLFGKIENIQTRLFNFTHTDTIDFEDSGIAVFDFENGGMCSFNFSTTCWDKNFESSISIVGTKGSVKVGGQYMNEIEYCHVKDYTQPDLQPSLPPNDYGFYKGSAANHDFVIQNVIDHLNYNTSITATAIEGLEVVKMIEQIYAVAQ